VWLGGLAYLYHWVKKYGGLTWVIGYTYGGLKRIVCYAIPVKNSDFSWLAMLVSK